jgi:hypothetical protein
VNPSGVAGPSDLSVTTQDGDAATPGVDPILGDTLTPEEMAASVPVPDQDQVEISGPDLTVFDAAHSRLFSVQGPAQDVNSILNVLAGTSSASTTGTTFALQASPAVGPGVFVGTVASSVPGVTVGPVVCLNWQMYKIQPGPNTNTINVVLRPKTAADPLDEGVSVIDDTGHRLDEVFPSSKDGTISVDISMPMRGLMGRNPVFLQVFTLGKAGSTSTASPTMTPYVLTFTQSTATASPRFMALSAFAPKLSLSSGVLPNVSGKSGSSSSDSLAISGQDANPGFVATAELTSAGLIPIPAATGPLPTRSAAPLGGVLDGDPIPQIDRLDAAKVDLDLIGSGDSGTGGGPRADEVVDEPEVGPDGPLVAVRGPGGFPLLASGLGDIRPFDPAASIAFMPWTSAPRSVHDVPETTPSGFDRQETETPVAARSVRRSPAMYGLSLAMALGFGLVLPDLVSTFQQRDPRRCRLRLRQLRGPRRDRV